MAITSGSSWGTAIAGTGNNASITVTPTRTYDASSGPCREYTMDATVDGKRDKVQGTACRQPDGTWKSVG